MCGKMVNEVGEKSHFWFSQFDSFPLLNIHFPDIMIISFNYDLIYAQI